MNKYDIIIIGAGPAGLTAALYALRANKKVLILEAKTYGGQIINANLIENYPGLPSISGFEYATNLYNQVKDLKGEFKFEKVLKITKNKTVTTTKNKYQAHAIIIATGAETRKLNLPNEEKFLGNGISYCATCDGAFYKDKIIAVNGGGNTALEDALYLSNLAHTVYLIHRRKEFRSEKKYQEALKSKKNIKIILNSTIESLNGAEKLESLTLINTDGEKTTLTLDGLFIAIGRTPQNEIFKNVVELDEFGYIISPDGIHTKTKNIYVAGDTRQKLLRQLTTAVSDGSIAATIAIEEMAK